MPSFSGADQRYARQIKLPGFGASGQTRLQAGSVLIIGLGGLGSSAALYLTAAGVGGLGLVDNDRVELSNLQRQILHFTSDQGIAKTESAASKLTLLNPEVHLEIYPYRVEQNNIFDLMRSYAFILDCTDNWESKFLISDACVQAHRPFNHAGIKEYSGQTFTYLPDGHSACLRCLFPQAPTLLADLAHDHGVLGTVPGIFGAIQATEALKYFLGGQQLLTNRLLTLAAQTMRFQTIRLKPSPDCPICHAGQESSPG